MKIKPKTQVFMNFADIAGFAPVPRDLAEGEIVKIKKDFYVRRYGELAPVKEPLVRMNLAAYPRSLQVPASIKDGDVIHIDGTKYLVGGGALRGPGDYEPEPGVF